MMSDAAPSFRSLANIGQSALQHIADAQNKPLPQLTETANVVAHELVHLRDGLIERVRSAAAPEARARARGALEQVNIALSLIVAVQYPAGATQHEHIKQARAVLQRVLDEGLYE